MPSCFKADFNAVGFIALIAFLSKVDISTEPGDNLLFFFLFVFGFLSFNLLRFLLDSQFFKFFELCLFPFYFS